MKKALTTVLVFAVIMAALLGVARLVERLRPAEEPAEAAEAAETVITNMMTPDKATVIEMKGDSVSLLGMGAEYRDGTVTIAYPGTYRLKGSLDDGQLAVDLGDFDGAVYLIMDGADIACSDGPAIRVLQSDLTVLSLTEGTENTLRDGAAYVVQEGTQENSGAALYSADDLRIEGGGVLNVWGMSADGIRSKDALTMTGGTLRVYAADDGLQGSDGVDIQDGSVMIWSAGDGVSTTEGGVTVSGGTLSIWSGGDGIDAATTLDITGGRISVKANGGAGNYVETALADISAKGLKAESITVSGGVIDLDTADDGIHGARNVTVTGGELTVAAGDDAIHAAAELDISGVEIDVSRSYEALEGDTVRLRDVTVAAAAENNGVDAGEGGFWAQNTVLTLAAPRAVSSDGMISLLGGSLRLDADGTDSLFAFQEANITGADILAWTDTGRSEELLKKGRLPGSLLYVFNEAIPAGTPFVLTDPAGAAVMEFTLEKDAGAVLIASGALTAQTYTMTAGEKSIPLDLDAGDCAVYEEKLPAAQMGGFPGGPRR